MKKSYFDGFGIEVTKENAKAIEQEIAKVVGVKKSYCPEIWREMKVWLQDETKRNKLGKKLGDAFGK